MPIVRDFLKAGPSEYSPLLENDSARQNNTEFPSQPTDVSHRSGPPPSPVPSESRSPGRMMNRAPFKSAVQAMGKVPFKNEIVGGGLVGAGLGNFTEIGYDPNGNPNGAEGDSLSDAQSLRLNPLTGALAGAAAAVTV